MVIFGFWPFHLALVELTHTQKPEEGGEGMQHQGSALFSLC